MPDEGKDKTPLTPEQIEAVTGPDEGASWADAMNDIVEQHGGAAAFDQTPTGADTPGQDTQPAGEGGDEPPRGKDGRFISKEAGGDGEPQKTGAEGDETQPGGDGGESGKNEEDDVLEPPAEWSAAEHERFRALPRETQQFLLDKVNAAGEGLAAKGRYEAIESLIAPRRDNWARRGMDDAGALKQMFSIWDWMATKPEEFLHWFADQNGMTLEDDDGTPFQPANAGQQQPQGGSDDDQYADPEMQALATKLAASEAANAALTQRIDNIEGRFQTENANSEQQRKNALLNELQTFAAATDDKGRSLRPYIRNENVRAHMAAMLRANPRLAETTEGLAKVYNEACWADSETRAKLVAADKAAAKREEDRKAREHAEAARRAGSSVSGTPGSRGSTPPPTGSWLETAEHVAYNEMGMPRS